MGMIHNVAARITDAGFAVIARCESTAELQNKIAQAQRMLRGDYGELEDEERDGWQHELKIAEKELKRRGISCER